MAGKRMIKNGLEYVWPVSQEAFNDVIIHLRNNFFADEPLCKSLKLSQRGVEHKLLEVHYLKTLKDDLSIVVYDVASRKVAGVILNKIFQRGDLQKEAERIKSINDVDYRKIMDFMTAANLSIDLFNKFNVDKLLEHSILSVDQHFRKKNIAYDLTSLSESIARMNGFKLLKADCTSDYSKKVMEKIGFISVLEIFYKDHKTENGEVVFNMENGHNSFNIMVKCLET